MKAVDSIVIVLVVLYVAFRWMWGYGVFTRTIVVLPFSVHGDADQKLAGSLASSVQARLNRLREIYAAEQEQAVAGRLAFNLGLGATLTLPAVQTFDRDAETITLKPFELGPVTIALNSFIFERLPKRATVLTGTYERYGDAVRIAVHQDGRPSFLAEGSKAAQLPELIDSVVYQLVAANWISDPSARWPAVKQLTDGIERYAAFIDSSDPARLPEAIAAIRKAVASAPSWPIPKLYLGWVLFAENQNSAADDALPRLREAAGLLDDVALNAPDRRMAVVGRIAALHVYSHIVRNNLGRCDEIAPHVDSVRDALAFLQSRPPQAGDTELEWRIRMAQGNGALALAQMLDAPGCRRVAARLLQGQAPAARAIALTDEAERYFSAIIAPPPEQKDVAASATYNLALTHYLRAELLYKSGRPEAEVMQAADAAGRAFAALNFPARLPFLRAAVAHLHLLRSAAIAARDAAAAEGTAAQATEQLRMMTFEQQGFPAGWARQRKVDTLLAEGSWVAGVRALLDVLDSIRTETASLRTGYWNVAARGAAPAPPPIADNGEVLRAAGSGVLHAPDVLRDLLRTRLKALVRQNTFAVAPAVMTASIILDGSGDAGLDEARALMQTARDRMQEHAHLWVGRDVIHLLDAVQARLAAAAGDAAAARPRLVAIEQALTRMGNGRPAVLCEMIRAYRTLGDSAAAGRLEPLLPDDIRPLLAARPPAPATSRQQP
jgi:hypothetical protein